MLHTQALAASIDADRHRTADRRRLSSDAEAIERLFMTTEAGDHETWASLVSRFGPRIRSVARANCRSVHDVEDVVQATWLELITYLRRIREPQKVGAWLHTTAQRKSIRVAKAAARETP